MSDILKLFEGNSISLVQNHSTRNNSTSNSSSQNTATGGLLVVGIGVGNRHLNLSVLASYLSSG